MDVYFNPFCVHASFIVLLLSRDFTLLFPDFAGHVDVNPRDVIEDLARDPPRLFRMTGETPQSVMMITHDLQPYLTNQGRGRRHRHLPSNRILMIMIWLRQYPTYDVLSSLFNMSQAAVTRDIYVIVPLLWYYFKCHVSWPSNAEWLAMRGRWGVFPMLWGP